VQSLRFNDKPLEKRYNNKEVCYKATIDRYEDMFPTSGEIHKMKSVVENNLRVDD